MIVLDASVVANAVGDDDAPGKAARQFLGRFRIAAPDLVDVETASVLRRRWQSGDLSTGRFRAALGDLADLPIVRYPTRRMLPRVFALRDSVTPYDAVYVALAEALEATLITADRRLASAPGVRCRIEVVA